MLLGIEVGLSTCVPAALAAVVVCMWQATRSTAWGGSSLGRGVSPRDLLRVLLS